MGRQGLLVREAVIHPHPDLPSSRGKGSRNGLILRERARVRVNPRQQIPSPFALSNYAEVAKEGQAPRYHVSSAIATTISPTSHPSFPRKRESIFSGQLPSTRRGTSPRATTYPLPLPRESAAFLSVFPAKAGIHLLHAISPYPTEKQAPALPRTLCHCHENQPHSFPFFPRKRESIFSKQIALAFRRTSPCATTYPLQLLRELAAFLSVIPAFAGIHLLFDLRYSPNKKVPLRRSRTSPSDLSTITSSTTRPCLTGALRRIERLPARARLLGIRIEDSKAAANQGSAKVDFRAA